MLRSHILRRTAFATALLSLFVSVALATKTFSYVCRHDGCKNKGQVISYEESTPHEHKCGACGNRMDLLDNKGK